MAAIINTPVSSGTVRHRSLRATQDPWWIRVPLIAVAVLFIAVFMVLPLWTVFSEALAKGFRVYVGSFEDRATLSAIQLTLTIAAIAVPLNTVFGLAAAWTVTRFRFQGRRFLSSLIELPVWVSPVIGGLIYVLLYGKQGWFGPYLQEHDIKVVFALPGMVLATVFVTFPFVARTVIPQMEAQGSAEEEAAMTLGAGGWRIFFLITLPKIKWSLIYGIILCNARSMGEFGAVSVVSGHIRGATNTMPLHVEILYNDYQFVAAFAVASLLCLLALLTLVVKAIVEAMARRAWRLSEEMTVAAS